MAPELLRSIVFDYRIEPHISGTLTMRITFILPTVSLGGGTRVVVIYAQALMRMGHLVRIISPPPQSMPLRRKLKSWILGSGRLNDLRRQCRISMAAGSIIMSLIGGAQ